MSYFLFGQLNVAEDLDDDGRRTIRRAMVQQADRIGLAVASDAEPPILQAMRDRPTELPFFIRAQQSHDTSEPLLESFAADPSQLTNVTTWMRAVLGLAGVLDALLWVTDGYDDAFEERTCRLYELRDALGILISNELSPSTLLRVVGSSRTTEH